MRFGYGPDVPIEFRSSLQNRAEPGATPERGGVTVFAATHPGRLVESVESPNGEAAAATGFSINGVRLIFSFLAPMLSRTAHDNQFCG